MSVSSVVMDKLEELYFVASNGNCFKEIYEQGLINFLRDLSVQQNRNLDFVLLALTVVQKLYQRLDTVHCQYLRTLTDVLIVEDSLLGKLLKYLGHKNQHVVFSAAKAITVILQRLPKRTTGVEWTRALFDFTSTGIEFDNRWSSLYAMEILRKLLKVSRANHKRREHTGISERYERQQESHCQHNVQNVQSCTIPRNELAELLLDSLNLQHVFFQYVPFLVRPNGVYSFVKLCQDNSAAYDFVVFQASLKLGEAIHDQENNIVKQDTISGKRENNFVAFLRFVVEVVKHAHVRETYGPCGKDCDDELSTRGSLSSNLQQNNEEMMTESSSLLKSQEVFHFKDQAEKTGCLGIKNSTINQLCTVVATLIQYLHCHRLPSPIFKKILEVVKQVQSLPRLSLFYRKSECAKFEKIQRISAVSFLCLFECCFLNKLPKCSGYEGFCGTEIMSFSNHNAHQHTHHTDVVALRTASLAFIKSCFVGLKAVSKKEGSSFFEQLVLTCLTSWCVHIVSLGHDIMCTTNVTTIQYSSPSKFCSLLVVLFCDQDDELVEVLLLLLLLHQGMHRDISRSETVTNLQDQLNPHLLFFKFVQSIEFDHSVLLDLLISSETRFLEYIVHYLHFVIDDWRWFSLCVGTFEQKQTCSEAVKPTWNDVRTDLAHALNKSAFPPDKSAQFYSQELNPKKAVSEIQEEKLVEQEKGVWKNEEFDVIETLSSVIFEGNWKSESHSELACAQLRSRSFDKLRSHPECNSLKMDHIGKTRNSLESISVLYSSSDESDDGIEGNINVCHDSTETVGLSHNLEKIMTMLIRLRIAVVRLSSGGHFPYDASPLISLIETVEKYYDDC